MPLLRHIGVQQHWKQTQGVAPVVGGKARLLLNVPPLVVIQWNRVTTSIVTHHPVRLTSFHNDPLTIIIPWVQRISVTPYGTQQGSFSCSATFDFSIDAISVSNRFQVDTVYDFAFVGEAHNTSHCDATFDCSYEGRGLTQNRFSSSLDVSFEYVSSNFPTYSVPTTIGVQYFVRQGQSPECYYDNANIPTSAIRNYVF